MLWQKDEPVAAWVTRFTVGEDYRWDTLLLHYDIVGTRAHAAGLTDIGLLSADELRRIDAVLEDLDGRVADGSVVVRPEDEDCHTVIEGFLTERLGDTGRKIHTGRSRNDQVLTALRLYLRDRLRVLIVDTAETALALCDLAERHPHMLMPGYTHLQRAMPSTVGLWATGYAELMLSDLDTLRFGLRQLNTSPLGSAAGYGVPFLDLPRRKTAEALGFEALQTHVTSVQLSRGKLELQAVHALVQVAATCNRLASDLVLFNTAEFGFVRLPAAFCTGSSIMPQKQNPDVLELARAHYHRVIAEMQVLLTLPANLPSGYHRDLQLTKEAVMRSVQVTHDVITAFRNLLPGVHFDADALKRAMTPELYATADALERVVAGTPFREAYRQAAAALDTLQEKSAEEVLASYRGTGFPGRIDVTPVRTAAEAHRTWAQTMGARP